MIVNVEPISLLPEKSNGRRRLIVGAVISVLAIFAAICAGSVLLGIGKVVVEIPQVEAQLDIYMKYMAAKDLENAYALFSPNAQSQVPPRQLKDLITGNNYALFEGYKSLSVQNLKIITTGNIYHPALPKDITANANGVILYEDGFQGTFDGTLEKVDGQWYIYTCNIVVPPNKFHP